jgi:hypothetical protein
MFRLFGALVVSATVIAGPALAEVILVQNGQAQAVIVPAAKSEQAQKAAAVLQKFVGRITGATLPIGAPGQLPYAVHVGPSATVQALGVEVPAGHTHQFNEEGFVVATVGSNLVLAGNEEHKYLGTLYAVYDLLDDIGCRWYFPGEWGEVIPKTDTLIVEDLHRTERPSFRLRNIWCAGWAPDPPEVVEAYTVWKERNRVHDFPISAPGDGSVTRLAPPDKYFESHPHIYALDKLGERRDDMLCTSQEDTLRIAVKEVTDYFKARPESDSFGFGPPDGHPVCHCEACQESIPGFTGKGYGDPSLSDAWFVFANKVAQEVYKQYPNHWLLTNGYANRVRPPEGIASFSPNLGIQSAVIAACTMHRVGDPKCWQRIYYQQMMDRWSNDLDLIFIYDYDPGKALENLPAPWLHNIANDMKYFRDRGIWGFMTEGTTTWMVTHLNYYVRARLMWNADEDVEAIVRDYCENFYGAAAKPVEKYIWTLEGAVDDTDIHATWGRILPWRVVLEPVADKLNKLMAQAEAKADDDISRKHLGVLRSTHDHMMRYYDYANAVADGKFEEGLTYLTAMESLRDTLAETGTWLIPHDNDMTSTFRSSLGWHKMIFTDLAAKFGGAEGEAVAMLPRHWDHKEDPKDIGVLYQWYLPENGGDDWDDIDTTLFREAQGYHDDEGWGYHGKLWYRTGFDVPADAAGKPLTLTIGAVYNRTDYNRGIWVWVNGHLQKWEAKKHHRLGHHDVRAPIHIDVTDVIRPGETNHVAVLVHAATPGRNPRSGLHRRSFLWSPREDFKIASEDG